MKRITLIAALFACGLFAANTTVFAQSTPDPGSANWFDGYVNMFLLGRDNVASAKFEEYRLIPKGVSLPFVDLQGSENGAGFAVRARNVFQSDQRYTGGVSTDWIGLTFDYNQIPHNMGYNGQAFFTETAPGVWSVSPMLRQSIANAVESTPTTGRTYAFYRNLLAGTLASAASLDVTGLRQRGAFTANLGQQLPFNLAFTYLRDEKTGYRGASGGDILGAVTSAVDVLEPMNEVTQDFGVRWAVNRKTGNAYATFNYNVYNDRVNSLVIDNPFRATDRLVTGTTTTVGGPAQALFSTSPDNKANRAAFGAQFKFKRQTRVTADVAFGRWTQDAAFLPFTLNSAIVTPSGVPANTTAALPQASLNGKVNTTSLNFGFSSRPVENMVVRLRFRSYDLTNKTTPISWLGGSTSDNPDRGWAGVTASAEAPYGFATANLYDSSSQRFDAQVAYDIKDLTLEGAFRTAALDRTNREATSGNDNGYAFSALYNTAEWLGFRVTYDYLHRTAKGETLFGFQADEAERKTDRVGLDVELTPSDKYAVTFAYFRRNDDYPDRPNRLPLSQGVPVAGAQPIPGTPSGLLKSGYDTYTVEFDLTPSPRAEVNAYYSWEKSAQTNQWSTTTGVNLNNLLRYNGSDRGNTFGVTALFHVVPEKWTASLSARHQKVNGLMDITANEGGAFYASRTTVVPQGTGGAQDVTAFDDTELTSVVADLAHPMGKGWTFNLGYAYDKYTAADAFSDGTTMFPQSVLFFLKANDGGYTANIVYTRMTYRF